MATLFHVTSALNRESIHTHGLDWNLLRSAPGIAGSRQPEAAGVFLCHDDEEAQYFVRLNNTGGPVDVWAVDDVALADLIDNGSGYQYLPARVPATRITLVQRSLPAVPRPGRES